jgi:phosphopantetheinyl transferase (holo-ACP synthase)
LAVGNDIVDLHDAGEPSARFLDRVLAPAERRSAQGAAGVWRLWAAKEAAFKVLARAERTLPFTHRAFVVDLEAAVVRHPAGEVRVRWDTHPGAVSCVGWRGGGEPATSTATLDEVCAAPGTLGVEEARGVSGQLSIGVRLLCKRLLASRLGLEERDLEIRRPGGRPPEVWRRGRRLGRVEISLAHDGRYLACAARLDGARPDAVR